MVCTPVLLPSTLAGNSFSASLRGPRRRRCCTEPGCRYCPLPSWQLSNPRAPARASVQGCGLGRCVSAPCELWGQAPRVRVRLAPVPPGACLGPPCEAAAGRLWPDVIPPCWTCQLLTSRAPSTSSHCTSPCQAFKAKCPFRGILLWL